ncbi:RTA1-like protein [Gloeopeniophorella convolvens]|nr:RTA1-like protein [Gloeopeniophorella convolvens]
MSNSSSPPPLNTSLPFFPSSSDFPSGYIDQFSPYSYLPTLWVGITFVVLFGGSTIYHIIQAIYYKLYGLIFSAGFCGILQTVGWAGRVYSSHDPIARNPFIIQFILIIIAPTALVAANFTIFGRIVRRLGPQYSRLKPKLYARIFLTADITSLLAQAMGGAIAAGSDTHAKLGSDIALMGIVFQLGSIAVYVTLATEFLRRYSKRRPIHRDAEFSVRGFADKPIKRMIKAISLMTVLVIIRSIYRALELSEGGTGTLSKSQIYFVIFDATMITLAMWTLNIFHPGKLLLGPDEPVSEVQLMNLEAGSGPKYPMLKSQTPSYTELN